ncbi:tetratricopeptide repeat protein [Anaeromyxobacter terrae]|uniref:tetratricopeptide repeat protein n=1 Tax=Anaeromyxobacter terrae TaxID=2925406 RepID=UPI001F57DD8F|nr:tetratricopeptide repeat protein [Anaeromyxobacter sp. SG22]
MTSKMRISVVLLALAAACATGGGGKGRSERFYQANYKLPVDSQLDDAERGKIRDARTHYERGLVAQQSGNIDQARAEWVTAAEGYAQFADQFVSSEWRMPVRYRAAELYMQGMQFERAAEQAQKVATDAQADASSKAVAARLAAGAWLNAANQKVKANQLEPIKLANADQRRGEPLKPRVPPGEWKRFVEATDVYLQNLEADPELKKPAAERRGGLPPAQLALIGAEVEYAFDNMDDARRRFDEILKRWPTEGEVLESAVPLYLQTFLYANDEAGYQSEVARVRQVVEAQVQKATDPKEKESYGKVLEALSRAEAGTHFASAQKLLDEGKAAEAAQAFEQLAADPRGGDAANALHNAAVAWDKAGKPERAAEVREKILKEHGDSKVAPNNMLLLAVYKSKKNDHVGAAKMYEDFLQKNPESPNRCVALQNVASELDLAKKPAQAAERYVAFGKDEKCASADANVAARALYRAGRLFEDAKQKAKAKEAYAAAVATKGVTDTVAKSQIDDAKRRMGKP